MTDGPAQAASDDVEPAFGDLLRRLKRRGCNLLVTGNVPPAVDRRATRRLLGDPAESRRRVLVFPETPAGRPTSYLPVGVDPADPDVDVVSGGGAVRSESATATGTASQPGTWAGTAPLRRSVVRATADPDREYDAGEFRVGVDSLETLLAREDPATVRQFLCRVGEAVTDVRGMGHYRLRVADDDGVVADIDCAFDARIELRVRDRLPPEHRWHVPDHGLTTDWVRL